MWKTLAKKLKDCWLILTGKGSVRTYNREPLFERLKTALSEGLPHNYCTKDSIIRVIPVQHGLHISLDSGGYFFVPKGNYQELLAIPNLSATEWESLGSSIFCEEHDIDLSLEGMYLTLGEPTKEPHFSRKGSYPK